MENIDNLCINTIRCLSADMVEKAKSGHQGNNIFNILGAPLGNFHYNNIYLGLAPCAHMFLIFFL
jgi:hypothetical protein